MTTHFQVPGKDIIAALPLFPSLGLADILLPVSPEQIESALLELKAELHLGFDTESKPTFRKGEVSDGPHLVQFATAKKAYLFQTNNPLAQAAIAELLHAPQIAKLGFGLSNDTSQLKQKFGIHPQNLVDLDRNFRQLGYKNSVGAKSAIAILFQQRFAKSKSISTSNWSLPRLTERQIVYAGNDAYAAICVFNALQAGLHPKAKVEDSDE